MGLFDKKRESDETAQPEDGEAVGNGSPDEMALLASILAKTEQENVAAPGPEARPSAQQGQPAPGPATRPAPAPRQAPTPQPFGTAPQAAVRQMPAPARPQPRPRQTTRTPPRSERLAGRPERPGSAEQRLDEQRDELRRQRDELMERYAELQRQQEQLRARQQVVLEGRAPAAAMRGGEDADARLHRLERSFEDRLSALQGEYRTLNLKMEQQIASSEAARAQLRAELDKKVDELERQSASIKKQRETIDEQKKVIDKVNEEMRRLRDMDLDAFISQEKQVLQKLAAEIKAIKASMQEAQREGGLSPDEAKLVKSSQYIKKQIDELNTTFSELDERLARVRNELVRVSTLEYKFKGVEDRLTAMQRNLENIIEVQIMEKSKEAVEYMQAGKDSVVKEIQAIFAEQKKYIETYENQLSTRISGVESRLSKNLAEIDSHFEERLELLKKRQKEAETALDKKLEMDSEYTERLQTILKTMKM